MSQDSPALFDIEQQPRLDPLDPIIFKPAARTHDPHTSHLAAASVTNLTATQKNLIAILDLYGPATDEEIATYFAHLAELNDWERVSPSGLRSRRAELTRTGTIYDTGARQTLKSGRQAIVWELREHL